MAKMFTRAGRAATLNRRAFTESFFDHDAAADGAIMVALVGAGTYIGRLAWAGVLGRFSLQGLFQVVIGAIVSWLILAFATWFITSKLFGASGRPQTMIAMHGLAVLPLLLEIGGGLIAAAGLIWYLVVLVVATREASDLDFRKAAVSVLIGFALAALIRSLINVPFSVFSGLG
jgi:hypothetical protein